MKAHFVYPLQSDDTALLHNILDDNISLTIGDVPPSPAEYHILVCGRPTKELIEASPNLHTLIIPWAGLPDSTRQLLVNYPRISVHNLHHNAIVTAETALALLLAAAKLVLPFDQALRGNDWRPRYQPNPALLLESRTVLILGYGNIGQHVARVCQAMGMHILTVRRNPKKPAPTDIYAEIHHPQKLHDLLPRADVLMITLPLTEETEGLIGQAELGKLPSDAILVNVGRGPIVDQKALYDALKNDKLHSAGLDVWYNYPQEENRACTPPAAHPFHELDNVVMSPHRGGGSKQTHQRRMHHLAKLLNKAARGESLPNQVDLKAGY
jgi:phosphoglycerate dehydrogenase-like enzyme